MEMQIKLNPKIIPMVNNLKVAVAFPDVSSNPIFVGLTSCFRFSDQYGTWTDPSTSKHYCVNELSDLYSEVPILQSNYIPGTSNVINIVCTASGYDLSMNNYSIPLSSTFQYNLDDYLAFINKNIKDSIYSNEIYGSSGTQTQLRQDVSSNILFDVHVKKVFTTNNYVVVATGKIAELFNMAISPTSGPNVITVDDIYNVSGNSQVDAWDLSANNVFSNNYQLTSISFDASSTLQVYPRNSSLSHSTGNKLAFPFIVSFESGITFNNITTLVSKLRVLPNEGS
jgi:hypothetical protein